MYPAPDSADFPEIPVQPIVAGIIYKFSYRMLKYEYRNIVISIRNAKNKSGNISYNNRNI